MGHANTYSLLIFTKTKAVDSFFFFFFFFFFEETKTKIYLLVIVLSRILVESFYNLMSKLRDLCSNACKYL